MQSFLEKIVRYGVLIRKPTSSGHEVATLTLVRVRLIPRTLLALLAEPWLEDDSTLLQWYLLP